MATKLIDRPNRLAHSGFYQFQSVGVLKRLGGEIARRLTLFRNITNLPIGRRLMRLVGGSRSSGELPVWYFESRAGDGVYEGKEVVSERDKVRILTRK